MRIREYANKDAEEVSALVVKNLLEVNTKDYSHDLMAELVDCFSPDAMDASALEKEVFVGVEGERIVATAALVDDGWIHDVFVDTQWHGRGMGSAIVTYLEFLAKSRGYRVVKLPSSITAVGFYEKLGYKLLREVVSGEGLTEALMEKEL